MNKKLLLTLLAVSTFTAANAQIPNASFEYWTSNSPDEWLTNNVPPAFPISQSTDAHSGTYAIRGQVVDFMGSPFTPSLNFSGLSGTGFPITQGYTNLDGWYKADMISSDIGSIQITVYDNSTPPSPIGFGFGFLPSSPSYQAFSVPITYTTGTPASMSVGFSIVDTGSSLGFVGSYFIIDDLALTGATQVKNIATETFSIKNNPVNDFITLNGEFIPGKSYQLFLINSEGKIVRNEKVVTSTAVFPALNISDLPQGNYFLSLTGNDLSFTRSFIIAR